MGVMDAEREEGSGGVVRAGLLKAAGLLTKLVYVYYCILIGYRAECVWMNLGVKPEMTDETGRRFSSSP